MHGSVTTQEKWMRQGRHVEMELLLEYTIQKGSGRAHSSMVHAMALVSDSAHGIRLYSHLFIGVYTNSRNGYIFDSEYKNGLAFGKRTNYISE